MSTEKLLNNRINTFTKDTGNNPSKIHLGIDIFCSLLDECSQDYKRLNHMSTYYDGIPLELIDNYNSITSKLIILN